MKKFSEPVKTISIQEAIDELTPGDEVQLVIQGRVLSQPRKMTEGNQSYYPTTFRLPGSSITIDLQTDVRRIKLLKRDELSRAQLKRRGTFGNQETA